ncbi:regulatory protein RecX [Aureimonas populi]|uniref:Regulatory protein RecX n=1 Tax=Aureimonas populi TaxID=1701758 RepID=A0ABW5CGY3_9HYPH|nr:RecX family transcriptional regulator [Aureimonas populi]
MDEPQEPAARPRKSAVTPDYLWRAATHYLERYASSRGNLKRILERKAARRFVLREEEPRDVSGPIEEVLDRLTELKLLDDAGFAEAKLASLRRRGASRRQAEARLRQKGVDRQTLEGALAADETSEEEAARAYARRRRLGPWRTRERGERRDRDLAAMIRAGFSFEVAAPVIDGAAEDAFS